MKTFFNLTLFALIFFHLHSCTEQTSKKINKLFSPKIEISGRFRNGSEIYSLKSDNTYEYFGEVYSTEKAKKILNSGGTIHFYDLAPGPLLHDEIKYGSGKWKEDEYDENIIILEDNVLKNSKKYPSKFLIKGDSLCYYNSKDTIFYVNEILDKMITYQLLRSMTFKNILISKSKNSLVKKDVNSKKLKTPNKIKKKLRYLYYSNGGIRGYFDDGTVVGCPRCDLIESNVLNLYNEKPIGKYKVLDDGSLFVNNSEQEFPNYNEDNGWALIDYKWHEKPQD